MNIKVQIFGYFGQKFLARENSCVYFFGKISGITGQGVASGEGVLVQLTGDGGFKILRHLGID